MYITESGWLQSFLLKNPRGAAMASRNCAGAEGGWDAILVTNPSFPSAFQQVRFVMLFRKLLVVAFVIAVSAGAASAYTLVMRSGRRVEIPNTFTLSKSTLTYETAPGIQVSVQLVSID